MVDDLLAASLSSIRIGPSQFRYDDGVAAIMDYKIVENWPVFGKTSPVQF
jgi:hypothetical protein